MSFKIVMRKHLGSSFSFWFAAAALASLSLGTAAYASSREDNVQRVLTLLSAVGEEYREGVRDGAVVRPIELAEAKTFLDEARQRFTTVAPRASVGTAGIEALFDAAGD